jgi:hypothetical protein
MKKPLTSIVLFCLIILNVNGQNDTTATPLIPKKHLWQNNFGIKYSILTCRQAAKSYSSDYILNYSSKYSAIAPEISLLLFTQKEKFIMKNELALTLIRNHIKYDGLYHNDFPDVYLFLPNTADFRYGIIDYKLSLGIAIKKFIILPGLQFGVVTFGSYENLNNTPHNSVVNNKINIKNGIVFGPNLEAYFKLSKKWLIGSSFFYQLNTINVKNFYPHQYSLSSIQISVIKCFFNKNKAK